MVAPAFGTRFPDGWSQYTDGDTSSLQSSTPSAVTGVSGFATGTAMQISLPANNVSNPGPGATADSTHQRTEVIPNVAGLGCVNSDGDVHNPTTGYFGLAIKLDPNFPTTANSWQLCTQFKNDGSGSPPLELKIGIPPAGGSQGYFYLDGNSGSWSIPVCPANPGQVYGIVLGITFTESASTSKISVWVNGTLYVNNASPTGAGFLYAGIGDYWKVGIYRDGPNIPQAATIWYGALAEDSAYQPVADYISATTASSSGSGSTGTAVATGDLATGAEQSAPAETPAAGAIRTDRPSGAEQGSPRESAIGNQGANDLATGAEQGLPADSTTGGAISNTPVTSPDLVTGAEQSTGETETQFSGTTQAPGELPVVVVPPSAQGAPGTPPVPGPQHLAMPCALLPNGSYATVAQDSQDDIVACVSALLKTRVGSLIEVPAYGTPDPTFLTSSGQWAIAAEAAVNRWEPRAAGAEIPVVIDENGYATVQVGIPLHPNGPAV